ncbi:LamB/YcsF family protein [Actinopolyspora mortivallis]|uniref:LamB/YcsF family protein n=1 Tax=Actinopolyspora mortivallis TaxID=33906 RepID=UPI00036C385A|nr:5-oxoprolinase subunit PxpA [Actinopolyspora mortivallis]
MRTLVDLNADAGESFGRWTLGSDEQLIPLVTSVNIACGWHAGDPATMYRTLSLAREAGVSVGAHPGMPDLAGFGRRAMALTPKEAAEACLYQFGALRGIADHVGVPVNHVKPHGALYGLTLRDEAVADAVVDAVATAAPDTHVVLLAGPTAQRVWDNGYPVVREAFADLEYDDNGHIVIEPVPRAKSPQQCAEQAMAILRGELVSMNGRTLDVDADTICVHGDRPNAAEIAETIRARFEEAGVETAPMATVLAKRQ